MMKKIIRILSAVLAGLMLAGCVAPSTPTEPTDPSQTDADPIKPENKGTIKILSIGNSFSRDSQNHLWQVFHDGGYSDIQLGIAYIGGSSLDLHWNHMQSGEAAYEYHSNTIGAWVQEPNHTVLDILTAADWDIITLQQQSVQAGQSASFENLENILDWIDANKTNPEAKVYWNMTWAYEDGCTASNAQAYYNCEQSKMYDAIIKTTQEVMVDNPRIDGIIPTGTAIQNLRGSYIGESVCRDGYHLNDTYGRYTAALTLYAMFTGSDLSEITWVPDNRMYLMRDFGAIHESVLDALAKPFEVSEITAQQAGKEENDVADGELIAEWNFDAETTADSKGKFNAVLFDDTREVTGTYVDGVSGKALQLSDKAKGDKLWLSIPYDVFGEHQNSFTISLWYKATDYNTSGEDSQLFSLYNSSAEKFLFHSYAPVAFQNMGYTMKWNGRYGYCNNGQPYVQGEWVHMVYSVDGGGDQSVIRMFINGKEAGTEQGGDWTGSLMSELGIDTFTIGGKNPYKGGPSPKCRFYGAVDEVRLYAGVMDPEDAKAIYEENEHPTADAPAQPVDPEPTDPEPTDPKPTEPVESGELLAEINFDDSTTGIATLYDNKNKANGTFVDGVSGKGLQLSTKGGAEKLWLSVPYDVFTGSRDSFSISLWYKATGYNTSGEDSQLFSLYNSKSEKFLFYSYAAKAFQDKAFTMKWDSTYGYANVMTPYAENEWVHLVFCVEAVGNESRISAYVNGKKVEVDQGGEWANSLMSDFGIDTFTIGGKNPYKGGATPACLFYGMVDEIRIYSGALNAEQAAAVYNAVN